MFNFFKYAAFYYLIFVFFGVVWRVIESKGFSVGDLSPILIPGLFVATLLAFFHRKTDLPGPNQAE